MKSKDRGKQYKMYVATLVKDREFIFIRFFKNDYEKLTIKDIGTKYLVPYYKDGWKLLGIDYDTRYIKENKI